MHKTLIFVGEKKSGKSSLIAKYLDEPVKDDMKETTALEFRSGVRVREEKKHKVNIYELGGGRILSNLLQAPLNAFNAPSTSIVICIDLSAPGNTIDSLLYWLNAVKEYTKLAIDELAKKHPKTLD